MICASPQAIASHSNEFQPTRLIREELAAMDTCPPSEQIQQLSTASKSKRLDAAKGLKPRRKRCGNQPLSIVCTSVCGQTSRQEIKHASQHTDIHTYIQTDRQTDTQTDRQTDRQTDKQTDRQTVTPVFAQGKIFIYVVDAQTCQTNARTHEIWRSMCEISHAACLRT
jgi:polycomb protein EED